MLLRIQVNIHFRITQDSVTKGLQHFRVSHIKIFQDIKVIKYVN